MELCSKQVFKHTYSVEKYRKLQISLDGGEQWTHTKLAESDQKAEATNLRKLWEKCDALSSLFPYSKHVAKVPDY